MSLDPWAAPELQRRNRGWRGWRWGVIALCLAVLAVSGVFAVGMLIGAGMRPPGDGGSHVDLRPFVLALAFAELLTVSAGFIASVLAWRLNRGRVPAAFAVIVLSLWVGALLHDLL